MLVLIYDNHFSPSHILFQYFYVFTRKKLNPVSDFFSMNATLKLCLAFQITASCSCCDLTWHTRFSFFSFRGEIFFFFFLHLSWSHFFICKQTGLRQDSASFFLFSPSFVVTRLCRWPVICAALCLPPRIRHQPLTGDMQLSSVRGDLAKRPVPFSPSLSSP